jgi:hypothetical protein
MQFSCTVSKENTFFLMEAEMAIFLGILCVSAIAGFWTAVYFKSQHVD